MGCGTSTATNGPYPRQQYQGGGGGGYPQQGGGYPQQGGGYPQQGGGYPQQGGGYPQQRRMVGGMVNNSNEDRMAEGMIAGAAVGYMAGSTMGGGGYPMGAELPMGYHMGPTIGQPSLEVMGVDVI